MPIRSSARAGVASRPLLQQTLTTASPRCGPRLRRSGPTGMLTAYKLALKSQSFAADGVRASRLLSTPLWTKRRFQDSYLTSVASKSASRFVYAWRQPARALTGRATSAEGSQHLMQARSGGLFFGYPKSGLVMPPPSRPATQLRGVAG